MDKVIKFLSWLLSHKIKYLITLLSALFFAFVLFPFSDLSDLVSSQIAKATNNQIYVQFEKLHMSLFPSTGVAMEDVFVEAQGLPSLKAQELILTPSLSSLITQKPAGTISAKGFLNGNVEVSMKSGTKSDNGVERQKITLDAQRLSLNELRELAQLPVTLKGSLDITSSALIDLNFKEQPDVDLVLKIDRFELPASTVQLEIGPVMLPELKLSGMQLKGRLSAGKFIIEEGLIGKEGDEIKGTVKGNLGLQIIRDEQSGMMQTYTGSYSFDIDLNVKKSFQDRVTLLSLLDSYKTPSPDGARFKMRISGQSFQGPPNMTILR
jgi:type II secretion system protein N